jgi:amidohydrolase
MTAAAEADGRAERKAELARAIDRSGERLCAFGDDIFAHPEIGFREHRTATCVAEALRALGLDVTEGLAVTGVRAVLRGARPGPSIAVIGELDGLPVPGHPHADPATGVAHACGHNAQVTHLLAVATALVECNAQRELAGNVVFLAVPAEEFVDLAYRSALARAGTIEFFGGKAELMRLGAFDDIDLAMLIHASGIAGDPPLSLFWAYNGFIAKRIRFLGRGAHAAVSAHLGINALAAARLGLAAIDLQRDTFRDEDHIRVHPIVTHGGDAVNVVPAEVRVETYVRGARLAAIDAAAELVDRSMRAGALAVGAGLEIETLPGYLPLTIDRAFGAVFARNAAALVGAEQWAEWPLCAASTDAGDVSHVMPVLHPNHGGCMGTNHTVDFAIVDRTAAYLTPAKALAATVIDLLADDAAEARRIIAQYVPVLSREAYLAHMRKRAVTTCYDGSGAEHPCHA